MAVLGWLWRRRFADQSIRQSTPRRLVYCLPMRVLVEQTRSAVQMWFSELGIRDIQVSVLMGGEGIEDWDLYPERDAILIGTQDMLLSSALNRGYGISRYRWPMYFALLNNDCLWILDEIQLMGTGLATTSQLQGFRSDTSGLGTFGAVRSIWMSATLEPCWLKTVDFDPSNLGNPLALEGEDFRNQDISDRYNAPKMVSMADEASNDPKRLAGEIIERHIIATRTLVIVNTVDRARRLYAELKKQKSSAQLVLIHSRFRPPDRQNKIDQLLKDPGSAGTIVVSTQVVEAGVDVSAKTLFTELAPWASLVQRFGRCNRKGEFSQDDPAQIHWIDVNTKGGDTKKLALPYTADDLERSRVQLEKLAGKSAAAATLEALGVELPFLHTHVIRKKDVVELFDTTPDLAGNDLDIDRYVRDIDESDVRVFWRDLGGIAPKKQEPLATRDELCPAPIGSFRRFLENLRKAKYLTLGHAYRRNYLERAWEAVRESDVYPGQVYMLDSQVGGYNSEFGWTGEIAGKTDCAVEIVHDEPETTKSDDGDDAEPLSQVQFWRQLFEHTDDVCHELNTILEYVTIEQSDALRAAARWHDWGKAHQVFQGAILGVPDPNRIWAKAPPANWKKYNRRHFRHELASTLGFLQLGSNYIADSLWELSAYLIAAHHGKVRLSIRSMPGEKMPGTSVRIARGIHDGDALPSVDLGGGVVAPKVTLSLEPTELGTSKDGQPSWLERSLRLRDRFGPFRLAFLEALLRAADMRASSTKFSVGVSS